MIRIIIADDEHFVRLGIKSSVNWEENGFQIVGEAENGKDAVEKIMELKPDIVLLDITMPGRDGLDVLETVRNEGYSGYIVMLTCHEEFKFAQQAIRCGADDYVLKNDMAGTSLLDYLKEVSKTKLVQKQNIPEADQSQERFYYKINFLNNILNLEGFRKEDFIRARERFTIKVNFTSFYMILISIKNLEKVLQRYQETDSQILFQTIDTMIHESLKKYPEHESFSTDSSKQVILISFSDESSELKIFENLKEIVNELDFNFRNFLNIDTVIAVIKNRYPVSAINKTYDEARSILEQEFFYENRSIFWAEDFQAEADFFELKEKLEDYLKSEDCEKGDGFIPMISDYLAEIKKRRYKISRDGLEAVLRVFISHLDQQCGLKSNIDFEAAESFTEVLDQIREYEKQILESYHRSSYHYLIVQALKLIDQHYTEDIMLDDIADKLGVNASYLSRIFSKDMDTTFSAYLIDKRILLAKELIKTTNLKFYEIAEKCGFNSPVHFNNTFKKVCGVTPNTYRNQNSSSI